MLYLFQRTPKIVFHGIDISDEGSVGFGMGPGAGNDGTYEEDYDDIILKGDWIEFCATAQIYTGTLFAASIDIKPFDGENWLYLEFAKCNI